VSEMIVVIEGASGPAMTRELVQKANQVPGLEGSLRYETPTPGSKSVVGGVALAAIKLLGEKGIGPFIDLLSHFVNRERRAHIKLKMPNGLELEIESSSMQQDIQQVRVLLEGVVTR
jgi:hypothetical protein